MQHLMDCVGSTTALQDLAHGAAAEEEPGELQPYCYSAGSVVNFEDLMASVQGIIRLLDQVISLLAAG